MRARDSRLADRLMFVVSVTTNLSQRIAGRLVQLPAPVTFILSQLGCRATRTPQLHCSQEPCICAATQVHSDGMITMKRHFLSFGLTLGLCAQALAQLSPGNPLTGLEKLKDFETMRASSSDPNWRNGNTDARPIEPGGTLVLADLKGPGMIVHFWNTIAHQAPFYSRLITLRIYWDGEKNPSVECPIGDFFGRS